MKPAIELRRAPLPSPDAACLCGAGEDAACVGGAGGGTGGGAGGGAGVDCRGAAGGAVCILGLLSLLFAFSAFHCCLIRFVFSSFND